MAKKLFILLAGMVFVRSYAQEMLEVIGERVSLRAVPQTNGVLLYRAALGEKLVLQDNGHLDWVGVQPPSAVDLWVHREFVSNGIVLPDRLNIRSGPSLSHSVVGVSRKGDAVTVRGEISDWLRIAPTSNTLVWIHRDYVAAPAPAPQGSTPEETPVSQIETQTVVEAVEEVPTNTSVVAEVKPSLDRTKPQGLEGVYSGILQPSDPPFYKLVDDHFTDIVVAYVSGNIAQMLTFSDMKIEITGKIYWVEGIDLPVVRPLRIKLFPKEH